MSQLPLTNTDRDIVRKDFLACYAVLLEQKDVLLAFDGDDDGSERHKAAKAFLATLVSSLSRSSLLMSLTFRSRMAWHRLSLVWERFLLVDGT